jgi:hypothetical protein
MRVGMKLAPSHLLNRDLYTASHCLNAETVLNPEERGPFHGLLSNAFPLMDCFCWSTQ